MVIAPDPTNTTYGTFYKTDDLFTGIQAGVELMTSDATESKVLHVSGITGGLQAQIITVPNSSTIPTFGSLYSVYTSKANYALTARLSENKAIAFFTDSDNLGDCLARVIIRNSDDSISVGPLTNVTGPSVGFLAITALTENKCVITYANPYGQARVLNINMDNSISIGAEVRFEIGYTDFMNVFRLSDNRAVVLYEDDSSSDYLTGAVLKIEESTILAESPVVLNTSGVVGHHPSGFVISESQILSATMISSDIVFQIFGE
jgi:hypothetical protein